MLPLFYLYTNVWQANKIGISILVLGLAALGGVFWHLQSEDPRLAQQVLSGGICLLLFGVAIGTWWSVHRDLKRRRDSE